MESQSVKPPWKINPHHGAQNPTVAFVSCDEGNMKIFHIFSHSYIWNISVRKLHSNHAINHLPSLGTMRCPLQTPAHEKGGLGGPSIRPFGRPMIAVHSEISNSNSLMMIWRNMIVVTGFLSIINPAEFRWVHNQKIVFLIYHNGAWSYMIVVIT